EGDEVDVVQLAHADGDGRVVAARAGGGVAGEVLEGGDRAGGLQAAHVLGGQHAGEIGVLPHRLLDASPAVVAHDVQDGCEAHVGADRAQVGADPLPHLADQGGIEAGAPGDRGGV